MGFEYGDSKRLNINFKENFEISDVENLTKDIIKEDFNISYLDDFKSGVAIEVRTITDEQVKELETKLKEKYTSFVSDENSENQSEESDKENTEEIISVIDMPSVKVYDLVKIYIKPIIITTPIVLVFILVLYRKAGVIDALVKPLGLMILMNGVYMSTISILRIPVNEIIIALGVFVYAVSQIVATIYAKNKVKIEAK